MTAKEEPVRQPPNEHVTIDPWRAGYYRVNVPVSHYPPFHSINFPQPQAHPLAQRIHNFCAPSRCHSKTFLKIPFPSLSITSPWAMMILSKSHLSILAMLLLNAGRSLLLASYQINRF